MFRYASVDSRGYARLGTVGQFYVFRQRPMLGKDFVLRWKKIHVHIPQTVFELESRVFVCLVQNWLSRPDFQKNMPAVEGRA